VACAGGETKESFRNPVFASDFPDPFIVRVDDDYVAYGTNGATENVRTLRSRDLVHWQPGPDAMPELAPWALRGWTWAPAVLARGDGTYVLYYTARSFALTRQCVGRAVAHAATGPFVDGSREPLVCQAELGGSIDADVFRDADGGLYLYWKNDGNCCGLPTAIYGQRLSADGLRLEGRRAVLESNDAAWEGTTVEAPTMWREHDRYVLFYSGNAYNTELYAVGYATCRTPLGPCEDAPENPILASACRAIGPGHQAVVRIGDESWLAYHAWSPGQVGSVSPGRSLWLDPLEWSDGKPVVDGPTCARQPAP
jgi:beta-xylosidase